VRPKITNADLTKKDRLEFRDMVVEELDDFLAGKFKDQVLEESANQIRTFKLAGTKFNAKAAMLVKKLENMCDEVSNELLQSFTTELLVNFDANISFRNFEQLAMDYLGFIDRNQLGQYFMDRL
jgi:hypothetical protein